MLGRLITQTDWEAARLRIGRAPALSWPPPLETYCLVCRRMVEARPYGGGSKLIPVPHFRIDLSFEDSHTIPCHGTFVHDSGIGFGTEDPGAAFGTDQYAPPRRWTW